MCAWSLGKHGGLGGDTWDLLWVKCVGLSGHFLLNGIFLELVGVSWDKQTFAQLPVCVLQGKLVYDG